MKNFNLMLLGGVAAVMLAGCAGLKTTEDTVTVVGKVDLSPVTEQPADGDSLVYLLKNAGCKLEQREGHYVIHRSPKATRMLITLIHTLDARMTVIAGNIAHAEATRTPTGGPYRRRILLIDGAGCVGRIVEDNAGFRTEHVIGHPDADGEGTVLFPNVNLDLEMAELNKAHASRETLVQILHRLAPEIVVAR